MGKSSSIQHLFDENEHTLKELRRVGLFQGVDECFFNEIASLSRALCLKKGDVILKEGEKNEKLYLLLEGRLGVWVKGENIASLGRRGDLVGEMSVVSSQPCSATIQAEETSELLAVDLSKIKRLSEEGDPGFEKNLYRIYSLILTEKLAETNQKAKNFEKTNRELTQTKDELAKFNESLERKVLDRTRDLKESKDALEQEHMALTASHRKLEDLTNAIEMTFKSLRALSEEKIPSVQASLKKVTKQKLSSPKPVEKAIKEIDDIRSKVDALTEDYYKEKSIESRSVLLAESDKKEQVVAKMALGGTGVHLDIASSVEEAKQCIKDRSYDVAFLSSDMLSLSESIEKSSPETDLVYIARSEAETGVLDKLNSSSHLSNVLGRREDDRVFFVKNILTTVSKLITKDYFGLEKYLNWGVDVQRASITGSSCRAELIHQMSEYFKSVGLRKRVIESAEFVGEELLMNAIYDAPRDDSGNPKYNHLPRSEEVKLEESERGFFRYACDGVLAALSVEDPFGALDREVILSYLNRGSQPDLDLGTHEAQKGGAGLGLFQVIETADLIVYNVKKGLRTEVIALFNVDLSQSKKDGAPSFHFFYS
jgi:CRP-like cAMP-binding protein